MLYAENLNQNPNLNLLINEIRVLFYFFFFFNLLNRVNIINKKNKITNKLFLKYKKNNQK